jgi:4-hydroxybenzoate polyprenyltransferase
MWAKVARFMVQSSLLLSLDAILITFFGSLLYGFQVSPLLLLAAALVTFSVYTLNKATDQKEDLINKREIAFQPKFYIYSSVIAMLTSFVIAALNGLLAFTVIISPLVIGLLYSLRLSDKLPRIKEITGAKSIMVALSWSLSGAILPLSSHMVSLETTALVFIYIFCQVLINTVIFDSFDSAGDSASNIRTIPIMLGPRRTQIFLLSINSTLVIWSGFCYFEGFFVKFLPALILGIAYSYALVAHFFHKTRSANVEILTDGEWLLIVPLMKIIAR